MDREKHTSIETLITQNRNRDVFSVIKEINKLIVKISKKLLINDN